MVKLRRSPVEFAPVSAARTVVEPDLAAFRTDRTRIGDLLLGSGAVDPDHLASALQAQSVTGQRLGKILVAAGVIDERTLTYALARQLRMGLADLFHQDPDPAAVALISESDARALLIVPTALVNDVLDIAVVDPLDPQLTAVLSRVPVSKVRLSLATSSEIKTSINIVYRALAEVATYVEAFEAADGAHSERETVSVESTDEDAPIIQVVNKIITQALRDRASDVHIEPIDDRVRVRYRIDGALKEVLALPVNMGPALVSRIKIMSEMNIVERRRPQDGQFQTKVDSRELDVRVSTTATIWGEKLVMRLLEKSRSLFDLSELGMPDEIHDLYTRIVRSPFGMVVVSGPTGSGKTTTLYATLSEINRPDINVMTIEDPVEYVFPQINQIQISEQAGLTFATGLKSILRQDPDVILVGEVRDAETARIAVQSALTGHLVLSSVHAIDAVSALYRLLDMGIESFLVTSAINGVVAQRLVRRICQSCEVEYEPTLQEVALYRKLGGREKDVWIKGGGCNLCSGTGYYDRVGVYEVLALTDELRQQVMSGRQPREARELAITQGLRTLQSEAVRLVYENVTTIDEVIHNVFIPEGFE
jgi:type IV pilus assembly protein PilB